MPSVKEKQEKGKKPSDVRSLRHEDKSARSDSSLSNYIGQLRRTGDHLRQQYQDGHEELQLFITTRNLHKGLTDDVSREMVEIVERQIQMSRENIRSI